MSPSGPGLRVERILAPNPGPLTLEGTNTYLVGEDPCFVIDPGPANADHIGAVLAAAEPLGGIDAVLLTHTHADHSGGTELLGIEPTPLADGESLGPLRALATPGHAADHICLVAEPIGFSGDLVLGEGFSFVPPSSFGGSLGDYLASLRKLAEQDLDVLYPGHGPSIDDPAASIASYIEHREMRQRGLVAALDRGERSRTALQAEVWGDVPPGLGDVAAIVMQAHFEMLEAEGRDLSELTE